jgi:DNA modification methylase
MKRKEQSMQGRNKRSVWTIPTIGFSEAHFATFPPKLIEPCILAGCPEDGIVLDPFHGSGTTGRVAIDLKRNYIGIELNQEYIKIEKKIPKKARLFI